MLPRSILQTIIVALVVMVTMLNHGQVHAQSAAEYPPANTADIRARTAYTKYTFVEVVLWTFSFPIQVTNATNTTTAAPTTVAPTTAPTTTLPPCTTADPANATNCTFPTTAAPKQYLVEGSLFYPWCDVFTGITMPDSFTHYKNYTEVLVQLEIGGVKSSQIYYREALQHVGALAAAINLDNGVVTSIEWDQADCELCEGQRCMNGRTTCALEDAVDQSPIYVYLAWLGTDSNGAPCQTGSFLPSQFQQFAVQGVYNAAARLAINSFSDNPSPNSA